MNMPNVNMASVADNHHASLPGLQSEAWRQQNLIYLDIHKSFTRMITCVSVHPYDAALIHFTHLSL